MPLTRRGWALVAGSVGLAALGRTLGVLELFVLAAGGIGLAAAALVTVLMRRRVRLDGTRRLVPSRVHAGSDGRVELMVRNPGTRPSPVVTLRDSVVQVKRSGADATTGQVRHARFHVAPLQPGESNKAAYRLGAERRGLFRLGPLETVVSDPFGLVASSAVAAPVTELTVYPRVEAVAPPPMTSGHDPRSGGGHPTFLGSGEEFYGLRGYEVGDDLRRVHWPSTARQDDLMIRQHEVPWQGRVTVVLDVRAGAHTDASLEEAVSAAASLVHACWKRDSQVRLLTTDGLDSGFGGGPGHVAAVMEHLAVLEAGGDRVDTLTALVRQRATGAFVLITTGQDGSPSGERAGSVPLERLLLAAGGYGWGAVVLVARGADSRPRPDSAAGAGGAGSAGPGRQANLVVRVEAGRSFAEAWNSAVAAGPSGRGMPRLPTRSRQP